MPNPPATWDGLDSQGNPLRWDSIGLSWDSPIPDPPPTPKRMPHLRVFLGFTNATEQGLIDTTEAVLTNLYGNLAYDNPVAVPPLIPPVTKVQLQAALKAFTDAIGVQAQGGTAATAAKADARAALIGLLRKLAAYVQDKCGNNITTLLGSGFDAASTNRTQHPLEKPLIIEILNGNSGQIIIRVRTVKNAKTYEVRLAIIPPGGAPGPWQSGGLFTNSRGMVVNNLTPGTNYMIEVRAIGGSTGTSDWSDPTSHMSL